MITVEATMTEEFLKQKAEEIELNQMLTDYTEKATRYNQGKPKWSMIHFGSLEPMVKVLMYGEKKYSRNNWKKGLSKQEVLDSMQRHIAAIMDGEEIDPESREQHIGHIMCNCMFYSYFSNGFDNTKVEEPGW